MKVLSNHPNATTAAGVTAPAVLLAYGARLLGVELEPEVAAAIAGALIAGALFVGRRGVRGVADLLWRGSGE